VAVEGQAQHLPLHRVGVLELVDQHHREPGLQAPARGGSAQGVGQDVAQQDQQVVEVTDPDRPLAPLELLAGGDGDPEALTGSGGAVGVRGLEPGRPVADGGAHDLLGLVRRHRGRLGAGRRPPAQVEVVDDLPPQVVDGLDHPHAGLVVARHAQAVEHLLAEAVRRGDGGAVELRRRPHQPLPPQRDLLGSAGRQVPHQLVGARATDVLSGLADPLADPLPQLLGRGAAERREHELRQLHDALGDVAGRQGGDGVRLAGPGAGLEHDGAGGQRAGQVEAHDSAASSGSHSRRASSPNRWSPAIAANDAPWTYCTCASLPSPNMLSHSLAAAAVASCSVSPAAWRAA